MPLVPPYVASLTPYVPGKPIEEVEREYGVTDVAKLASNENALGPSPRALEAAREVLVGNGSNELIELLVRTFVLDGEEVLTSAQTFVAYRLAAQAQGRTAV